jgi:hypothetical protein
MNHAPYTGPLVIDVQEHKSDLVDLPPGATQRLKREKDGFEAMYKELAVGAEAEKLAEVLRETEIALEHAREGDVAVMAKAIQTTAQHIDATVTGTFENTLHYYSQIGEADSHSLGEEEVRAREAAPSGRAGNGKAATADRQGQPIPFQVLPAHSGQPDP